MVDEVELALALSARQWADELHRFLADHGGARVRLTVTGPDDLTSESFDLLLIDDICSFLTPRLVEVVRAQGRRVVGVYDPEEFPDGKDRLLECGVADVVEAHADPEQFLDVIARAASAVERKAAPPPPAREAEPGRRGMVVVVGGPTGGTGITEVAVTIADHLSRSAPRSVLVDADPVAPAVAQRLGAELHPNLVAALDLLEHRVEHLDRCLQPGPGGRPLILAGTSAGTEWREYGTGGVSALVDELARSRHVVVDLGSLTGRLGELMRRADHVVAVGSAHPVGVTRLFEFLAEVDRQTERRPADVLVNRAPKDRFRRRELVEELSRSYQPASFGFLPDDATVGEAAWAGRPVRTGRFRRALEKWADRFLGEVRV